MSLNLVDTVGTPVVLAGEDKLHAWVYIVILLLDIIPLGIVNYPCKDTKTMGRLTGSLNKNSTSRIVTSSLSPKERIHFLANLIIDRILEDQKNGGVLYKKTKS